MRPPLVSIAGLPGWMREQEKRLGALEENLQHLITLMALSPYGIRLPPDAERDTRLRRSARRIPFQRRPKAKGRA